jgi:glycosyltransferase involved in cell wall biosynthesis
LVEARGTVESVVSITDSSPRVSIGLPVHNGDNFVADAIEAFQAQTFEDFELIVSDNASTDDTESIVQDLASTDRRIRYLRSDTNIGANRNYNRTFFFAGGDFFKWAAHDDTVEPTYLDRCVEVLDSDPSVMLVHSATSYMGRDGKPLVSLARGYLDVDGFIERLLMDESAPELLQSAEPHVRLDAVINRMTVFYDVFGVGRQEAFRKTLLLRPYYGADKVFLVEVALQGPIVRVPEVLFHRRCHESASTRTSDLASLAGWSDPALRFSYYPLQMLAGYADAIRASGLPAPTRARCLLALISKARSPMKLLRGR